MQIVIDIPEELYNRYMNYTDNYVDFVFVGTEETIVKAIRKCTPLPKGKWIKQYQNVNGTDFEVQNKVCSECNKPVKYKYPFCPWCGADMRGDE